MTKLTLSPSSADRWSQCAASASLEKVYGEYRRSKYQDEGVKGHKVAQALILDKPLPDDAEKDMVYYGNLYKDFIDQIRFSGAVRAEIVETKLDTGRSLGTTIESYGYCDYAALISNNGKLTLWVVDYKYGAGVPIYARTNKQIIQYAESVLNLWAIKGRKDITVNLCIHQPRIKEEPDIWSITGSSLIEYFDELKRKADATGATFKVIEILSTTPSVTVCQFCSAKLRCKGLRIMLDQLGSIFAAHALEGFNGDPALISSLVSELGIGELTDLADKLEVLALLKAAVLEKIERLVESGTNVPGWGIGTGSLGNSKWLNEDSVVRALQERIAEGVVPPEAVQIAPIAPTKMLKLVTKKVSPELHEYLAGQIYRPSLPGKLQRMYIGETDSGAFEHYDLPTTTNI